MSKKRPKHKRLEPLSAASTVAVRVPEAPAATTMGSAMWTPALAIFALALAVRLIHIWQIRKTPFFDLLMGDARGYDEWAQRIAAGDWIGSDIFYQAPLYPYFLGTLYAVFGHSLLLIRICQALVGSFSCVLLALAGRRLFSPKIGLIAGAGLALYAPAIFFDALLQKSVLDEFFTCLMLWIAAGLVADPGRGRQWFWLGLATGGLSLTRENALVFVAVLLLWAAFPKSVLREFSFSWRTPALFVLGLALVLLPVAFRNNVVGGGFYLTTSQFGANFYMGNNPIADGTAMSLRTGRGSPEYERQDATDLAEQARGRKLTPGEVSSYWTEQSIAFIKSDPIAWAKLQLRKAVLLWNATEILDTESQETYAEYSLPLRLGGLVGHFGVLVPLALFGFIVAWPERFRLWPIVLMLVAYAFSVVMFYIYARYRYPLVPMLLLFAARGLVEVPAFVRSFRTTTAPADGRSRMRLMTAVAVVVAAVFTNWSMVSADMNRTVTESNLGAALQGEGRFDEAIASYRRALAITPDYAPAYSNIGTVLQAQGHLDEAIASYEKALALNPAFSDVHYNLANALLKKDLPAQAAEHFKLAAKGSSGSADLHNNLGSALAEQGKFAEAVTEFEKAVQFDPKSAKAHRNLGNTLVSAGRPRDGLEHLLQATQLDPKDASAHYDFGSLLLTGNLIPEAIQEFRAALAVAPDMVDAHNNLGIALGQSGKIDESIAEFREALRLQPDFADARKNLEMTLEAQKQLRQR